MAVYNSTPYQNVSTFPTGTTTTTVGKEDSSVGGGFQYWWGFGIVGAIILVSIYRTRRNRTTAQRRPVAPIAVPTNNETRNEQQPLPEQTSSQPLGSPIPMSFDPDPPEYDAIMTLNEDTTPPHYLTVNTSSNLDKSVTENDPPPPSYNAATGNSFT
uniref:Uncharacterized protein n=1 Tax=Ciona savignyi TaxID=51511 RepID=H2YJM7_CIOSA